MVDHASPTSAIKAKLILVTCVVFLAIQIAVPTVLLSAPRPSRFGWQMFSSRGVRPTFWVVEIDGTTKQINLSEMVGYSRADIDYIQAIPNFLCTSEGNVVAVRFQSNESSPIEEHPCP